MNPKLSVLADARGGWFTRADAMDCGYSDSELRRRLRSGQWARLSRDVYVEPGGSSTGEAAWDCAKRLHLLKTRAVLNRLGPGAVVSHQSAAVLHGLPTWGLDLSKVHVTKAGGRTRSDSIADVHRSRFDPGELTVVDGLQVVTPARAVAETACVSSYEVGVVLGDAALHERLVSPEALVATADRHSAWHGSPAARAAARFANGLSESVGESRLRVLLANHGLPEPELQVEIRDASGRLIARVDVLLERVCVVEFDGAMKYGNAEDLVAEKWREDDLRSRGYQVVRVGWSDLDHPLTTANRIRQGLPSVGGAPTWRGR
ncbi:type IV toxin-antitoxin system AbiEi family antitoxin domain-containing protein [Kribbella sp. NBC_00482]|uniref:type IV toxin-antitoxin system AbiEi family antitoxin domain-containing protein n=1 Tax=Kribbella sp. NBC_00482 TaxID=2975968 RepID=UPI002E18CDB5